MPGRITCPVGNDMRGGITGAVGDGRMTCAVGNKMPNGRCTNIISESIFIGNPPISVTEMAETPST